LPAIARPSFPAGATAVRPDIRPGMTGTNRGRSNLFHSVQKLSLPFNPRRLGLLLFPNPKVQPVHDINLLVRHVGVIGGLHASPRCGHSARKDQESVDSFSQLPNRCTKKIHTWLAPQGRRIRFSYQLVALLLPLLSFPAFAQLSNKRLSLSWLCEDRLLKERTSKTLRLPSLVIL